MVGDPTEVGQAAQELLVARQLYQVSWGGFQLRLGFHFPDCIPGSRLTPPAAPGWSLRRGMEGGGASPGHQPLETQRPAPRELQLRAQCQIRSSQLRAPANRLRF